MLYSLTTCFSKAKKESPANPLVYWTFWRRVRDSNPRGIAPKLISSVARLWQIYLRSRSFQAAL